MLSHNGRIQLGERMVSNAAVPGRELRLAAERRP
jgi:hypothetical protein